MQPTTVYQPATLPVLRLLLSLLATVALLSLSACPQKTAPGDNKTPDTAASKLNSSDETASAPAQDEAASDGAGADANADADAAAADTQAETSADKGEATAVDAAVKDEEKDLQRSEGKTPDPKGIWVDIDFMNATWNEDPEAKLSHLLFTIGADLARNDSVSTDIKMDDPDKEVYGELDLRFCHVRVYPYVSAARITRENGSKQEYTRSGRYVFMLLDPQGEGLAVLEMNAEGEFQPAPPDYQPEHTSIVPIFNDQHNHIGYDITRLIEQNKPVEKILQIRINRGAFVTHQVTDPLGNVFVYRFPEIHLLVAPPEVDTSKPSRPV